MRLTQLKLAGFKSFVDPTTLHIHGQRVGVVGPNGCGKSNVMESVRWVLGESSAKEMRADSMDAVIFNGSANRKPISRASVELIFDNSLGGASGEWSQYAEIAVKRVIERDKGSSYYINNTAVRRRDVADLFLGTGLGGRAYAIIGQNTISRIVEAKPEELRIFLEEAAGISKYKERRRETELRLKDTRENLIRVEDIRQELIKQISRLESQAVVAEQYHRLQETLMHTQAMFWWLKKRDASVAWEKAQRQVEKLSLELEAQMSALRASESALETCRQSHFQANDAMQAAQAAYYEVNAEVSNLEQQVRHTAEARERLQQQLLQIEQQHQKFTGQQESFTENRQRLELELQQAMQQQANAELMLNEKKHAIPELETRAKEALQMHQEAHRTLIESEQSIRLETQSIDHLRRSRLEAEQRLQRFQHELQSLQLPDVNLLHQKQTQLQQDKTMLEQLEHSLSEKAEQEKEAQLKISRSREILTVKQRELAQHEAQLSSLKKLLAGLSSVGNSQANHLQHWFKDHALNDEARLWKQLDITPGWETALESVLAQRLNAIVSDHAGSQSVLSRPEQPLSVVFQADSTVVTPKNTSVHPSMKPLYTLLHKCPDSLHAVLQDWLHNIFVLEDGEQLSHAVSALEAGQCIVTSEGDIYSRYSVTWYAAQSEWHGVIERQRELEALEQSLPAAQASYSQLKNEETDDETNLRNLRLELNQLQQKQRQLTQSLHQQSLDIAKLEQQHAHILQRQQLLSSEVDDTTLRRNSLREQIEEKESHIEKIQSGLRSLHATRDQRLSFRQQAEAVLKQQQEAVVQAERLLQEKQFNLKLIHNNINELVDRLNDLSEEITGLLLRKKEAESLLDAAKMDGLRANLAQAIEKKHFHESVLSEARNALVTAEQALQMQERQRMQNEQQLHPMRDKVEQARLNEQQTRIQFDQCHAAFEAFGIEESALESEGKNLSKVSEVESLIQRLQSEIDALGAVNLAAIQELATERERQAYLDSQASDLVEASNTLEEAIRKIDRETRSRLQQTFEEANRHFAELFAVLFNGGQAKLEMLGDEILDTGMQVFAQPPGKKNSTIHLLSGGEKALTAIALVFALFRLNPAPFCLMDEVDAPLDDSNTERFCSLVQKMSEKTQFLFISHNKITMEMAQQLVGVTMQESGVSRIVEVDIAAALRMHEMV